MKRAWLAAVLVAPLLAAVAYAVWPVREELPSARGEDRGEGRLDSPQTRQGVAAPMDAGRVLSSRDAGADTARAAPVASGGTTTLAARAPETQGAGPPTPASTRQSPPQPTAPHSLDRDGIRGAIHEKLPELQDCYDAWLQQHPGLGGTLKLSFQITEADGGGVVQNIAIIDGGVGHLAFEGCVANVFDGLDFEPPQNGAMNVTYPLVFSSTGAP